MTLAPVMLMLTDRRKPYYVRVLPPLANMGLFGRDGNSAPLCTGNSVTEQGSPTRRSCIQDEHLASLLRPRNSRQQTRHQRQHQVVDQILGTGQKALLSMET